MRSPLAKLLPVLAAGAALLAAPAAAQADFGLDHFAAAFTEAGGEATTQAGSHPFQMTTELHFNAEKTAEGGELLDAAPKDILTAQPAGFAGNPTAAPRCESAGFLTEVLVNGSPAPECPDASAVGTTAVTLSNKKAAGTLYAAVYNLDPPPGIAAKLGFWIENAPVTIELGLAESPPYDVVGGPTNISQLVEVVGATLTLWGVPADGRHDPLRGHCLDPGTGESVCESEAGAGSAPFLTMPRACTGPLTTTYKADPWQAPGAFVEGSAQSPGMAGCGRLGFEPEIVARPTSRAASSASGLDFSIDTANEGLLNAAGDANADLAKAVVTLPEGMSANPSSANGLGVCTEAQFEAESPLLAPGEGPTYTPPGAGCPEASKLGTIEVETPLLEETLKGSLYLAKPYANPEHTLIALYMAIRSARYGVIFKIPLKVEPDPRTGQLITTAEDLPQWPFSHFRLHFREGARSPLVTPPSCGTHTVQAMLYPSSGGAPVESTSSFEIIAGPNGAPCPSGGQPFNPGFEAGSINNAAGRYSPFDMRLTRQDGDQDLTRFSAELPPGMIGRLAGTAQCPAAAIAQARSRSGQNGGAEEQADPSCPADSQIGRVIAGAGVGQVLTYVPGSLYLAGPYNGAPLSVVAIVPALAGPFDAGTVVTQEALRIDPLSAEVEADGSASDPIPHILKGIPLAVRDVQVYVDKPDFTLNPTSCEPSATLATLWAGGQDVFSAADDAPHSLAARFQAASCASLGFTPKLGLKLKGGTRRGKFPALHAVYTPKAGDANLKRLALRFPHSEFIEQGHFRTICTRVQFAAGAGHGSQCPKGAVYGHVKVWTPLLSEPLKGPVYLRSSSHNLPDAVLALHGPPSAPIDLEVAVRIDSAHGGLRARVEGAPDAPVSRAIVRMQGGQKGLFVNSTNLCQGKHRARVNAGGQNGRREVTKPVMRAVKCGKYRVKRHKGHHKKRAHRRSRR